MPTVEELAARIQQLESRLNNIGGQFDDNQTIRAGNVLLLNNEADTDGDPSDVGQDPEGNTRKGTGFFASKVGRVFAEGTFNAGTAYQGALQAGFNTAGKLIAGAGNVTLDANGLSLTQGGATPNLIKYYSGSNLVGYIQGTEDGVTSVINVLVDSNISTNDSQLNLEAKAYTGKDAEVLIKASLNSIVISGGSGTNSTRINFNEVDADTIISGNNVTNLLYVDAGNDRVGIGKNNPSTILDVAGTVTTTGGDINGALVVNESGADKDMRVEGDTDQNLLFTDASADKVGIGTSAPATKLQVEGAVTLLESAAPSTPASNYGAIFQDTGSRPSAITDTALVGQLPIAVKATVNASATSGTGETVLATYTIPAGVLASAWDGVRITGKVDTTSGASTKTYRLRFGGASGTIIATGNTAGATRVRLGGWVWRTGAATQEAFGETLDAAGSITSTSSSPTQTLANAIDIVLTGQTTTAAHTVKNPMLMVEFLPMVNQ